jgi:hypothetical protein
MLYILANSLIIESLASLSDFNDSNAIGTLLIFLIIIAIIFSYVRLLIVIKVQSGTPFFVRHFSWCAQRHKRFRISSASSRN